MKRKYIVLKGFVLLCFITFWNIENIYSQNEDISGGQVFEGEPYLAVDPANPLHMVVEWMGYEFGHGVNLSMKTKVTFDGGKTWSKTVNLPHQSSTWKSADPSMVFDKQGNVIACYIDYRESPDSGGVYVIKSTDGGRSWANVSKVIDVQADGSKEPIDRPWLVIDNTDGAYSGNMYVTTKPPSWVSEPNRPYFVRSTDGGTTWSKFRYADTTDYLVGNAIAAPMAALTVTQNGNLHIMYPSWDVVQKPLPGYYLATSQDGGNSFNYTPAIFMNVSGKDTLAKAGYRLFSDPSDPNQLGFAFPTMLYGDMDVFFIESTDNGKNWTSPVRVNDDTIGNGKMQDLVWGDFNSTGDLVMTWRDRRNASGTGYETPSEIWGAVRMKDSAKFSKNFRISDTIAPYNNILSEAGNDFMTVCLYQDTLVAVWGDVRNGKLNIWFDKSNVKTKMLTAVQNIVSEDILDVKVYPNPSGEYIQIDGPDIKEAIVFDMSGKEMMRQNNKKFNIDKLQPGEYIIHIITKNGEADRKFIRMGK